MGQVFQGGAPADVEPNDGPQTFTAWARPNPFQDETRLSLRSDRAGLASLGIFGADGRLVRTFTGLDLLPGAHGLTWDGRDDSGSPVPSGVYFYRWTAGGGVARGMVVKTR